MTKSKVQRNKRVINGSVLDMIVNSINLTEQEKLKFLKYVGYMTEEEKKELATLV